MKKQKKFRLGFSIVLVLALVMNLLPVTARASETEVADSTALASAYDAAVSGDVITLSQDITGCLTLAGTGKTITIDGKGHTITGDPVTGTTAMTLTGSGTVILKDIILVGSDNSNSIYSIGLSTYDSIVVLSEGVVTVQGGAITSSAMVTAGYGISYGVSANGYSSVTITNAFGGEAGGGTGSGGTSCGISAKNHATVYAATATGGLANGNKYGGSSYGVYAAEYSYVFVDQAKGGIATCAADVSDYGYSIGVVASAEACVDVAAATGASASNPATCAMISYGVKNDGTGTINAATAIGGAAAMSVAALNYEGVINVTKAIGSDAEMYSVGVMNNDTGTVNCGSAEAGSVVMCPDSFFSSGIINGASGIVNAVTASGNVGVYSSGTGIVTVETATGTLIASAAESYDVYAVSGTVNCGTPAANSKNETGTINTISPAVVSGTLNPGTDASCVLSTMTMAAAGTTNIGRMPRVVKNGQEGTWYKQKTLKESLSYTTDNMTEAVSAFYSEFYEVVLDVSNTTVLPAGVTYAGNVFTIGEEASVITVTGTTTDKTIAIANNVKGLMLTLDGVSITDTTNVPIALGSNTVISIMVKDGTTNTLSPNSMQYKAGIRVPASASLCILGSSGKLNVTGGGHSAGIGGDYMAASGEIVINGSIVTANGGSGAAGIGGGADGGSGSIVINAGTVTANGGAYGGAGIGSGSAGTAGDISITGGIITAIGGTNGGAGIGAGSRGTAGMIEIADAATVMATSYDLPAIQGAGTSDGTVINAVLTSPVSATEVTFLKCGANVLMLPAGNKYFAFNSTMISEISVYSDSACMVKLYDILTTDNNTSIPCINLYNEPTVVTFPATAPTAAPTAIPTTAPTAIPTTAPTAAPTAIPQVSSTITAAPTATPVPTVISDLQKALTKDEIQERIANSTSEDVSFVVSIGDNTEENTSGSSAAVLPANALQAAVEAGKNLEVSFTDKDGKEQYSWTFDHKDLEAAGDSMTDVDLSLNVNAMDQAELSELGQADENSTGILLDFGYHGVLPAQATIRIYVGNLEGITAGSQIYLYHISESGELEALPNRSAYTVDSEGYITITIVHCSDYAVLTDKAASDQIINLTDQIRVTPTRKTLYLGKESYASTSMKVNLPSTLELVAEQKAPTSQSAIGGVTVTYASDNSKVATVDQNGTILATGKGTANIMTTITLYNGAVKRVKTVITVKEPTIKISIRTNTMSVGDTFTFVAKAYGLDSNDIVWTTTQKSILVIDKKTGVATAKSKGTDYVVAKIGDVRVVIKVTVQ